MCYPAPSGLEPTRHPLDLKKGEEITCENDHVICVVKNDVKFGAPHPELHNNWNAAFYRWRDPEPPQGAGFTEVRCCRCDAPWWKSGKGFHIRGRKENGGWMT